MTATNRIVWETTYRRTLGLLVLLLTSTGLFAQRKTDLRALSFMNIPVEGAVDSFVVRLKEKDFVEWGASDDGEDLYFRGDFYGLRAKLMVTMETESRLVSSMFITIGPYRTNDAVKRNIAYFLRKLSADYGDYAERGGAYYFFPDYGNIKVSQQRSNQGTTDINVFFQPTSPFYKDAALLGMKGQVQEVITTNPVSENAMERFGRDGKLDNPDIMERQYDQYGYLVEARMLEKEGTSHISYEYDDRNRLVSRRLTNEGAGITYVNEYIYNDDDEILNLSQKVYNREKECLMSVNMRNEYIAHDDEGNWTRNQLNIVYWEKGSSSQTTNVIQTRKIRYWDD